MFTHTIRLRYGLSTQAIHFSSGTKSQGLHPCQYLHLHGMTCSLRCTNTFQKTHFGIVIISNSYTVGTEWSWQQKTFFMTFSDKCVYGMLIVKSQSVSANNTVHEIFFLPSSLYLSFVSKFYQTHTITETRCGKEIHRLLKHNR